MKLSTPQQATEALKELDAKTFETLYSDQIEILDQDNIFNANDGDFNCILHLDGGQELSVLFYNGRLMSAD